MSSAETRDSLVQTKIANKDLVAERHAQIVAVCTELFLRKGFHQTSVREIADALGWQMGFLYLHIRRKEDILHLISQAIMNELLDGLRDLDFEDDDSSAQRLHKAGMYFFKAVDRMRAKIKLLYRESPSLTQEHVEALKDSELQERTYFADILRQGIADAEFNEINPELFAHDLIMLAHMWALKGWAFWPDMNIDDYTEQQLALLFSRLTRTAV